MPVTSIKKLKDHFEKLKGFFGKPIDLNKSSPKNDSYHEYQSKGVESDFVRIFKINKERFIESSFAFSFTNPEDSEKTLIAMSLKIKNTMNNQEELLNGSLYNVIQMKDKIREFVKVLELLKKINNYNPESVQEAVKTIFEFEKQNTQTEEMIKKAKKEILQYVKTLDNELIETVESYDKKLDEYNKKKKSFEKLREKIDNKLGISKLKERLKELETQMKEELRDEETSFNIIKKQELELSKKKVDLINSKRKKIDVMISKYPLSIQKSLKRESEKNIEKDEQENFKKGYQESDNGMSY
jgi:hypothetical protein